MRAVNTGRFVSLMFLEGLEHACFLVRPLGVAFRGSNPRAAKSHILVTTNQTPCWHKPPLDCFDCCLSIGLKPLLTCGKALLQQKLVTPFIHLTDLLCRDAAGKDIDTALGSRQLDEKKLTLARLEVARGRAHLTALGRGWNTVPACLPRMISGMTSGSAEEQMTIVQPAAVAMRAAVNLVTMPPVPHWLSWPPVSTCTWLSLTCTALTVAPKDVDDVHSDAQGSSLSLHHCVVSSSLLQHTCHASQPLSGPKGGKPGARQSIALHPSTLSLSMPCCYSPTVSILTQMKKLL